jgi:hypothetical protein
VGLAYFFVYFHRLSLSVVADDLAADFDVAAGVLGLLGSVYFYCLRGDAVSAGLLADSVGPARPSPSPCCWRRPAACSSARAGIRTAFAARVAVAWASRWSSSPP